jgi:hypothetical protein
VRCTNWHGCQACGSFCMDSDCAEAIATFHRALQVFEASAAGSIYPAPVCALDTVDPM